MEKFLIASYAVRFYCVNRKKKELREVVVREINSMIKYTECYGL